MASLPRRKAKVIQIDERGKQTEKEVPNEFVFSSTTTASGHLVEPRIAHDKACAVAGLDVNRRRTRESNQVG